MRWEDSFHLITFCSHLSSPEDTPDEVLIWKVLIKIQLRGSFRRNILVNFSSVNTLSKTLCTVKRKKSFCLFYSQYSGNECFCFNGDGGEAGSLCCCHSTDKMFLMICLASSRTREKCSLIFAGDGGGRRAERWRGQGFVLSLSWETKSGSQFVNMLVHQEF